MSAQSIAEAVSGVAAGIAVMTLRDGEGVLRGMTISSLTPVSSDPPSVLVCIGADASARPAMLPGQVFCANVLAADQADLSDGFAFGEADPFTTFPWTAAATGPPILKGTAAYLVCTVEEVVEHHGTAVVFAGVDDGVVRKPEALVYWHKEYYGGLTPAR